ncbi:MAG: hypothetical protein K2W86_16910, partial [Sphingomonas sp.]|uniref:hypothetical protein n=1 Tax=Sphingomonas sp. TaxID=28214 RepID=UPI0035A8E762|nr:hypothetical protein [Sphingomonas sp.]
IISACSRRLNQIVSATSSTRFSTESNQKQSFGGDCPLFNFRHSLIFHGDPNLRLENRFRRQSFARYPQSSCLPGPSLSRTGSSKRR